MLCSHALWMDLKAARADYPYLALGLGFMAALENRKAGGASEMRSASIKSWGCGLCQSGGISVSKCEFVVLQLALYYNL